MELTDKFQTGVFSVSRRPGQMELRLSSNSSAYS